LRAPVAILVILALFYLPFHNVISARLLGDDKGSAESRIPLMNLAWRIFLDHPVLGVGTNNFSVVMDRYLTPEFRHGFLFVVHDKYLLVLCETGIGGLLAFLAFLLAALRRGWQCWTFHDSFLSPLALGFAAGIAGDMVHMNVDVFRGQPMQQLIWLIAGLLVAMHRICAADQPEKLVPSNARQLLSNPVNGRARGTQVSSA
jgi:O-antigen ligase